MNAQTLVDVSTKHLEIHNLSKAEAFWRHLLDGFTASNSLVVERDLRTEKKPNESWFTEQDCRLSMPTTAMLQCLAKQHQMTLYTLLQGAWAVLLNRYSGESDILFGASKNCEDSIDAEPQLLPVRVSVYPEKPLLLWFKKIQAQWNAIAQYDRTPLAKIQEWSELPPKTPLFESVVMFENNSNIGYPLSLVASLEPELSIKIKFDRQRFDDPTIARMLGHIKTILEAMAHLPWLRILDLPMLTPEENYQLLFEWNETEIDYLFDSSIPKLFEQQVERSPDAVAVIFEDKQLTYRELNAKANNVAHYLKTLGVKPEVLVGICVERSLEMVIGLLGILKAGGAYVPLDPAYPQDRLAFMLQDTQVSVLLTQQHLIDALPEHKAHMVVLDTDSETIAQHSDLNPNVEVSPDNLAYVIYTSGSTGQPKGVAIEHRVICDQILSRQNTFNLTPADRILQTIPLAFDPSVWQIFGTLIAGATLIVAPPEAHKDSAYLVKLTVKYKPTILDFVPSMLQIFLEEPGLDNCTSIRHIFCGGEALPAYLVERFQTRLQATLSNQYGPTEACIEATFWKSDDRVSSGKIVPIGRPIANKQVYILNSYLQPVPIGVPGELYIGGGLARGYLNRPQLTAEKFISNPFENAKCDRLYKTGDLVRYLPDGNIQYLGRIDNQVKIRGVRIEVGEIEAALRQHPHVWETLVVARPDFQGNPCLVAYVMPKEQPPTVNELRELLVQHLPAYMIPAAFVVLDAIPLLPNGKVNRLALPDPNWSSNQAENFTAPRNEIEEIIADIFAEIIGVEQVGVYDNFFQLGGHSLLATQVISRISDIFAIELSISYLFENPTVAELSAAMQTDAEMAVKVQKTAQLLMSLAQLDEDEVEMMLVS